MFQQDFTRDEFVARRATLCKTIGDSVAIVQGAPAPLGATPFRQYNAFYYLCGVEVPHAYLAIDGRTGTSSLFLPPEELIGRDHDEPIISTDNIAYARQQTGMVHVEGREGLHAILESADTVYTILQEGEGGQSTPEGTRGAAKQVAADPWDGRPDRGTHFATLLKSRYPNISRILDLHPIVWNMRLIKSPREIELSRRAGQLSARGLCDAMRATRPGVMEYQIDAVLQYHYRAGGARDNAYTAIVAGGKNAYHGHYHRNQSILRDGDLVLVDCGPDYHYYSSDITRMWPVNGRFTPAQRAIYGFVTEYHKVLLAAIRPGRVYSEIEHEARTVMRDRLGEFDFASPAHAAGAEWTLNFNSHLAHSVGMSVHDGREHYETPLKPGTIFAVDPQMKIPEDRLYLRVEDTVVVTEDGIEVLTKDVPLELDDIEAMMKEDGILQTFPPLD